MKRRNFLQLLGVGGIAALAPAPLFGAEGGPKLWTPGQQKTLAGGHIVLVRPKASGKFKILPGDVLYSQRPVGWEARTSVASSRHGDWPIVTGDVFLVESDLKDPLRDGGGAGIRFREQRAGEPFPLRLNTEINMGLHGGPDVGKRGEVEPITVLIPEGRDPHLAFYQASMKMRDDFKASSAKMLQRVPVPIRPHAQIVTIVDNPIYAGPVDERIGEGFTVEADYDQYVVNGDIDANGWEVYSEFGEFPIEVPGKIDMDMLLVLDAKVFNGDLKIPNGARRILA